MNDRNEEISSRKSELIERLTAPPEEFDPILVQSLSRILEQTGFEFGSLEMERMYMAILDAKVYGDKINLEDEIEHHYPSKQYFQNHFRRLCYRNKIGSIRALSGPRNSQYWPKIRSMIEYDQDIVKFGDRRGSKYRHRTIRPKLPRFIMAEACLLVLEESQQKMRWFDIWEDVVPKFHQIHSHFENGSPSREDFAESLNMAIDRINHTDIQQFSKQYPEKLENWISKTYSSESFYTDWPVIQRRFSGFATHVKGARGEWVSKTANVKVPIISRSNTATVLDATRAEAKMIEELEVTIELYKTTGLDPNELLKKVEATIAAAAA